MIVGEMFRDENIWDEKNFWVQCRPKTKEKFWSASLIVGVLFNAPTEKVGPECLQTQTLFSLRVMRQFGPNTKIRTRDRFGPKTNSAQNFNYL